MPVVSDTSNGNGTRTVRFDTTPIMSTYLVAFVVGEFEKVSKAAITPGTICGFQNL